MKHAKAEGLLAAGLVAALGAAMALTGCGSDAGLGQIGTSTTVSDGGAVVCESSYAGLEDDAIVKWIKSTVYNVDKQESVYEDIQEQQADCTLSSPLIVYNPFGTNAQSLYVYFDTERAATTSYTVSVSDEEAATISDDSFTADSIPDFKRTVEDESSLAHEFLVTGLIPGVENEVTIQVVYDKPDDDNVGKESITFSVDMCDVLGDEELQLVSEEGSSDQELEDGLYAVLGNEESEGADYIYFYDSDGFLRGEVPIIGDRTQRLVFEDDAMYFGADNTTIAAMSDIGQIVKLFEIDGQGDTDYHLHHDTVSDGNGHLMVLASDFNTDTVEDLVLFLNEETGDVDYVLDMGDLLPDFKEDTVAYYNENVDPDDPPQTFDGEDGVDWIHLNSVQWMGNDTVLVSSRQTSSIMKISNVSSEPVLEYIVGPEEIWEGTGYEDLVYDKEGDFLINGGQHSVEYVEDDSLPDGQYYAIMFDNNVGISTGVTSGFDYSSIGLTHVEGTTDEEGVYSYYYKYLIDENEGTFELAESFEVPYSGYCSSVQDVNGNVVVNSGMAGVFGEYTADGELIRSFEMECESLIYRICKYDL